MYVIFLLVYKYWGPLLIISSEGLFLNLFPPGNQKYSWLCSMNYNALTPPPKHTHTHTHTRTLYTAVTKVFYYLGGLQASSADESSAKDFLIEEDSLCGVLLVVQKLLESLEALSLACVVQNLLDQPHHLVAVVLVLKVATQSIFH